MNKLAKVKATLRSQLSDELCKPITDHKSFVEIHTIELLISVIEMAYGLLYKHDDHTTSINPIDAQLEKINSQAREQDRLEMITVLPLVRSLEMESAWTLNCCSIRSGEYSNPMNRRQKMTIHYKRHCLLTQDEL